MEVEEEDGEEEEKEEEEMVLCLQVAVDRDQGGIRAHAPQRAQGLNQLEDPAHSSLGSRVHGRVVMRGPGGSCIGCCNGSVTRGCSKVLLRTHIHSRACFC